MQRFFIESLKYDKTIISVLSNSKTRDQLKFYRLPDATLHDRINTIYQLIKPFLDKNAFLEEYGAFKAEILRHMPG